MVIIFHHGDYLAFEFIRDWLGIGHEEEEHNEHHDTGE